MFEDFGERLRKLRVAAGLTQAELGRRINRGITSISKYESGAMKPTLDVAVDLAFQLRVSLDELFGYENRTAVSTFGLTEAQKDILSRLIALFRAQNKPTNNLSPEQYEIIGRIMEDFRA
ncbi:MAG: helix-turn-helix domain-containing protein [Lachnospiraceae bacterium]|nr:helix-turn-helix domain-containing protein [Ruminococcus sp.]MCM1274810.1 helix-turn-helix domain-containing protein [Lachnospiraceae bacterium]